MLTKIVVTMTVLFSIPVVSLGNMSDFVTAILSTSFQYPICGQVYCYGTIRYTINYTSNIQLIM